MEHQCHSFILPS